MAQLLPTGKKRTNIGRYFAVTLSDIVRIARAKGIKTRFSDISQQKQTHTDTNVTNVINVTNVTKFTEQQQRYLDDLMNRKAAKVQLSTIKTEFGMITDEFLALFDPSKFKTAIKQNLQGDYLVINAI